jgi:hypothetical protein
MWINRWEQRLKGRFPGYLESGPRERCQQQQGPPVRVCCYTYQYSSSLDHFSLTVVEKKANEERAPDLNTLFFEATILGEQKVQTLVYLATVSEIVRPQQHHPEVPDLRAQDLGGCLDQGSVLSTRMSSWSILFIYNRVSILPVGSPLSCQRCRKRVRSSGIPISASTTMGKSISFAI